MVDSSSTHITTDDESPHYELLRLQFKGGQPTSSLSTLSLKVSFIDFSVIL